MKQRLQIQAFLILILLPCTGEVRGDERTGNPPGPYSLAIDFLIPGYGAVMHRSYVPATLIFTGRILTAYAAIESWRLRESYGSAERAARIAGYYYGPGYRYYDPLSGGFKSPEEFGRIRDRYASYYGTALALHTLITGFSLFYTHELNEKIRVEQLPAFEIGLNRIDVRFIRLDF
jgi:hypothetical protein